MTAVNSAEPRSSGSLARIAAMAVCCVCSRAPNVARRPQGVGRLAIVRSRTTRSCHAGQRDRQHAAESGNLAETRRRTMPSCTSSVAPLKRSSTARWHHIVCAFGKRR